MLLTSSDAEWCTSCDVYLIVNQIADERLYVTAQARSENTGVLKDIDNNFLANEGRLECESYSIGSAALDTIFQF